MDKETSKSLFNELREIAKKYNVVVWLGGQNRPMTSADSVIALHRSQVEQQSDTPTNIVVRVAKNRKRND